MNNTESTIKDNLFLNHIHHDDHLSVTVNHYVDNYIQGEVVPYKKLFDEALKDAHLGAHVMLPTTPGPKTRKAKDKLKTTLTPGVVVHQPPLPGKKSKKRKVNVGEYPKKTISNVTRSQDDTTVNSDRYHELSNPTTFLSETDLSDGLSQDVSISRFTRKSSRRGKKRGLAIKTTRVTRNSHNTDESNLKSPSTPSLYPCNSTTYMSTPPERPALPSFSTFDSSVPTSPPAKPDPPLTSAMVTTTAHQSPEAVLSSTITQSPSTKTTSVTQPTVIMTAEHDSNTTELYISTVTELDQTLQKRDPSILQHRELPIIQQDSSILQPREPPIIQQDSSLLQPREPSIQEYSSILQHRENSIIQQDSLDKSSNNSKQSQSPAITQSDIPLPLPNNPITTLTDFESEITFATPQKQSVEIADSSLTLFPSPSFVDTIPAPTPSKTFSVQKLFDSDLCLTPPFDISSKHVNKSSSRPIIQSPLLEQYPAPPRFTSKYDHLSQDNLTTPINPTPMLMGATHTIPKATFDPRNNSPSKFHKNCSPLSNTFMSPFTPNIIQRPLHGAPSRINLNTRCKPSPAKQLNSQPKMLDTLNVKFNRVITDNSVLQTSTNSTTQANNSSLRQIPKGLVSSITGKFQTMPGDILPGKLATTVSTFFNKKPVIPAVKTIEEARARAEQKQNEDDKRVVGLMNIKQQMLEKKKHENIKRQQIAAERRAEIERIHKEKYNQKLVNKEEKRKVWERQSQRKKKAEEERRKREEAEKKRADISQLKTTMPATGHVNTSTTFNTSSFLTVPLNDVTSYYIDDLESDNTDDDERPRHQIPSWATEPYLSFKLRIQCTTTIPTDPIFPPHHLLKPIELTLLFEYNRYRRTRRPYNYRTSSAHWTSPMFKPS
ncbi:hypothetical protein LOD99_5128 [Oopsacas minuta]|uniref:Inner centromere protein ARK-binding domain-containing protein n=1 Tax=Oopsacas minuta TaxID=111878 RepID=A0AAV7JSX4_9METZ|nr:hypothetical protein LOD99_5128 [Oopsacas minuta]